MVQSFLRTLLVLTASAFALPAVAAPVTGSFQDLVSAQANLFNTGWGHSYTAPIPAGYSANSANLDLVGVGTGQPARAYEMAPGAPLPFTAGQSVKIEAPIWSWVIDLNIHGTDAFGVPEDDTLANDPAFKQLYGFDFRGLRVYSLIAIWSTSAAALTPYIPAVDPGFDALPFLVGYELDVTVPQSAAPLYLFFGDNDGYLDDNASAYDVFVTLSDPGSGPGVNDVPVPGTLALFTAALLGNAGLRAAARRRARA